MYVWSSISMCQTLYIPDFSPNKRVLSATYFAYFCDTYVYMNECYHGNCELWHDGSPNSNTDKSRQSNYICII